MGGTVWFNSANYDVDNGVRRYVTDGGGRPSISVSVAGRPADSEVTYLNVVGGEYDSWSWSGSTFTISNAGTVAMRGNNPGNGPTAYWSASWGSGSWTGGMGGHLDWRYTKPGSPSLSSASRSSNGTSLTVSINSGSGRVTGNYVNTDAYTWYGNGSALSVGAHSTVKYYGLSTNEDQNSGWVELGTSYGIPTAVQNYSVARSSSVGGRIDGSWTAPSYAGSSLNRYVVNRYDTVSGATTTIINSNTTAFNDTGLVRGRLYNYTIYAIGNNSPGNGLTSTISNIMAPGVPGAPGVPTITSKVGRTLTLNTTRGSTDYGNAVAEYRIQLSTDNGATWKGWNNTSKSFTANGEYNVVDSSGNMTYQLLTPALTYLWRVQGVNSVGGGDYATTATGTFVGAGGKRNTSTGWEPTQTSKRYDAAANNGNGDWIDFTIAKRYDAAANNGNGAWLDLT